jgi:hypothetical protein
LSDHNGIKLDSTTKEIADNTQTHRDQITNCPTISESLKKQGRKFKKFPEFSKNKSTTYQNL